jgi:mannose/fructose/sorbose-specific phosphotransferase system IIA component
MGSARADGKTMGTTRSVPAILVVAHGNLAAELVASAAMIAGDVEDVVPVSLAVGERPEDLSGKIASALERLGPGRPAVLLVDLFGGSPATAAAQLLERYPSLEIVTGVNLPMLLELLLTREGEDAAALASSAARSGQEGVVNVRGRLRAEGILS